MNIVAPRSAADSTAWRRIALAGGLALLGLAGAAPAAAAVIAVTTLDDADVAEGDCSLREAILAANSDAAYQECPAGFEADEIEIAVAGTIVLTADLPQIVSALTVRGLGAGESAIDGGGTFEILHITNAAAGNGELLRVEGLQLTGGRAGDGGAIFAGSNRALEVVDSLLIDNRSNVDGGAIRAEGAVSVTIERCSVIGNTAGGSGGGLAVQGTETTVVDSTIAGNVAEIGPGGGIHALFGALVTVRRSTLSGNLSSADGGGLAAVAVSARVESSTVVGNFADADADDGGDGGGVSVAGGGAVGTLVDSLVAANADLSPTASVCPDGLRKLGGALATEGFNLIGANECMGASFPAGQPNLDGDQVGTLAAPIDPVLTVLDDHGGPTFTHLPLAGSPAIDQGSCPDAVADQRGYGNGGTLMRIVDDPGVADFADGCDVGAVEAGAVDLTGLIFADGFESGDTGVWSSAVE